MIYFFMVINLIRAITVCPLMMAEMDYPLMVVMDYTVIFVIKCDKQITDGLYEAELDHSGLILLEGARSYMVA